MATPHDNPLDAVIQWIPCPGCAGEIGVPPHWLAHTIACPKCGAIVSISKTERVLWRPPRAPSGSSYPAARKVAVSPVGDVSGKESRFSLRGTFVVSALITLAAFVAGFCLGITIGAEASKGVIPQAGMSKSTAGQSGGSITQTSVFGIEGVGNRFVYVFDRSASMGSGSGSPLALAKRELLKSVADLKETNQFQIIFYNERFSSMTVGQQFGGLLFADWRNQELAKKYVRGIMTEGGTRHGEPLEAALRLAPDVIFFLSDADYPELSAARLAQIKRLNAGKASIHTIEFGLGAKPGRDNFLAKLARQNGGKYAYIDISNDGSSKPRIAPQ